MTNQNQATTQDAQALMQLYDLRREPLLRTARKFMISEFWPQSYEEFKELMLDFGNERNAFARQCFTYWDMAAAMVLRGAIHEELFFENNTEMLLVWERVKGVIGEFRKSRNNPMYLRNLEKASEKFVQWINANAPEAYETFQNFVNPGAKKA